MYRSGMTCIMLGLFAGVVYHGPPVIVLGILFVQCKVYRELQALSLFGVQPAQKCQCALDNWLFFLANAWILAETFAKSCSFQWVATFRLGCVLAYCLWFACSIALFRVPMLKDQLAHFCWQHVIQLYTTSQVYFLYANLQFGSCVLVICNDIFAFLCGQAFGVTQLVTISPKKTWEGFIGAAFLTILVAGLCAPWLVVDKDVVGLTRMHALVLAGFASFMAPFGGFFASALKRAKHVKDFADAIPGHGGFTDRMDCQLLMAIFTHLYLQSCSAQAAA
ncbi:phosphatidate cytidylyltransferase [Hesseltinella vesiculosa]|uniref:Phosphatidate cytidylyltransferase n=1 Tax=Hesseltinella vesiculosa TaxID=101127 RepID=A0A1X2GUH3_9FUNG|nr:phosphatidate cytidylyltransferase [Hesseltinella vesiculosa]